MLVFLIYGAAFLLLGTVILVQSKQGSRFALSRVLWLLATFALLHGTNEWLDMLKRVYGSGKILNAVGLIMLLTSFAFLFEFGRRLVLVASPRMSIGLRRFLTWPVYILLIVGLCMGGVIAADPWQDFGIWGRYLLGFPGAMLSGVGLVLYYRLESYKLEGLGVKPYFFLGGIALIAYGLFSGLIVPATAYFPGNWLNYENFRAITLLPVQVVRALCAVVAAFAIAKLLRIFNWEAHQQLEEALHDAQASAARFKSMVESTSDWVWEVNVQGVYTYVSPKVQETLGYTPEEVLGGTPFDLMPPGEAQRVRAIFDTVVASQQPCYNIENTNRHKDGHEVVLETNAVPVFDASGNLIGYRGMDRDVTGRRQAEQALRRSEASLAEAQRIAMVGSWVWDIVQNKIWWSVEAYRIYGVPEQHTSLTYAIFLEAVHPADRDVVQHAVDAALQQGEPYSIEHRIVHPGDRKSVV